MNITTHKSREGYLYYRGKTICPVCKNERIAESVVKEYIEKGMKCFKCYMDGRTIKNG